MKIKMKAYYRLFFMIFSIKKH